jgi:hypothetical protein
MASQRSDSLGSLLAGVDGIDVGLFEGKGKSMSEMKPKSAVHPQKQPSSTSSQTVSSHPAQQGFSAPQPWRAPSPTPARNSSFTNQQNAGLSASKGGDPFALGQLDVLSGIPSQSKSSR